MASRKRKPWNANLGPEAFPSLHGLPPHEPKPMPVTIVPSHSTPAMPVKEKTQPAPPPTEKK